MKIKGCAKKMSPWVPVLCALVPGAALILLRVYQSLSLIDPATGFFTDKSNVTVPLFYGLAVGTALLTAVTAYICPLSKAEYIASRRSIPYAFVCLLFGAAVAYDSYLLFVSPGETANARLTMATVITGALTCAAMLLCVVSFVAGTRLIKYAKIVQLFPALWALCKTVNYFTINMSYLHATPLLLCIFADVFLMLFLFELARKLTGIAGDTNSPSFLMTGLLTLVLQLAAAVAGVIGLLPDKTPFLFAELSYYRFAAALLAVAGVILFFRNDVPDYEVAHKEIPTHPLLDKKAAAEAIENAVSAVEDAAEDVAQTTAQAVVTAVETGAADPAPAAPAEAEEEDDEEAYITQIVYDSPYAAPAYTPAEAPAAEAEPAAAPAQEEAAQEEAAPEAAEAETAEEI